MNVYERKENFSSDENEKCFEARKEKSVVRCDEILTYNVESRGRCCRMK